MIIQPDPVRDRKMQEYASACSPDRAVSKSQRSRRDDVDAFLHLLWSHGAFYFFSHWWRDADWAPGAWWVVLSRDCWLGFNPRLYLTRLPSRDWFRSRLPRPLPFDGIWWANGRDRKTHKQSSALVISLCVRPDVADCRRRFRCESPCRPDLAISRNRSSQLAKEIRRRRVDPPAA